MPGPARFRAFVGMGANLGPARSTLNDAVESMALLPWTALEGVSPFVRSKPVDAGGPDYLNSVVALQTALGPHELLRALLRIEGEHGRERPYRHAPRTLDLDLLWMDGTQRCSPALILPHPRMNQRAFVLEPLAALLGKLPPQARDPVLPAAEIRARLCAEQGIFLE